MISYFWGEVLLSDFNDIDNYLADALGCIVTEILPD